MSIHPKTRITIIICLITTYLFVSIITIIRTHSTTLVTDAMHMVTDLVTYIVSYYCITVAEYPVSEKYGYGYGLLEYVGSMMNVTVLVCVCGGMVFEAMSRLYHPIGVKEPGYVLVTACAGFMINLVGIFLFHDHDHDTYEQVTIDTDHIVQDTDTTTFITIPIDKPIIQNPIETSSQHPNHKPQQNHTLRTLLIHLITDLTSSILLILSTLLQLIISTSPITPYIDPITTIIICIIIIVSNTRLVYDTVHVLMLRTPSHIPISQIQSRIMDLDGIMDIQYLRIWTVSQTRVTGTLGITIRVPLIITTSNGVVQWYHDIVSRVTDIMIQYGVNDVTVYPDFLIHDDCMDTTKSNLVDNYDEMSGMGIGC